MTTDFCNLHNHGEFSTLDGYSKVQDIPKIAKQLGQESISLTDHGSLAGSLRFWKACKEQEVKPIIGIEGYEALDLEVKNKDTEIFHLILLAQNQTGLHNLFAISREAWTKGFYRKPRFDLALVAKYSEGLIATSSCMAGRLSRLLEAGLNDEAYQTLLDYKIIFGRKFFVELQPGNKSELNWALAELANKANVRTTVAVDSHYDIPEHKAAQEMLLVMQQVSGFKESDKQFAQYNYEQSKRQSNIISRLDCLWPNRKLSFAKHDLHIMSREEVVARMNKQGFDGNALADTTLEISEQCQPIDFKLGSKYLPKITKNKKIDSDEYLRSLAFDGLERIGKQHDQVYLDRIEEELLVISSKGFSDYFLIVWDIINEARRRNIFVGPGRGSAAGSLVAYCLHITAIDPIRYGLLFFRFIDPSRNDFPDIDMDFEHRRRDEMKEYIKQKYGEALSLSTFTTMKGKSLVRGLARSLCVPLNEVDEVCRLFNSLDEFKTSDQCLSFRNKYPEILLLADDLHEHISASGMHAAAVVVADRNMADIVPIETRTNPDNKSERLQVAAFEMYDCAELGLIKFDFLGLNTLTVIHDTLDLIQQRHAVTIDWENLEPNDSDVLAELNNGNTVGVFQMESSPYRKLLSEMGVDDFNDLVASNALVRPGAFNTVAKDYIERKRGLQEVSYPHVSVEQELSETFGVYIYQEQVMQLTMKLGGFSPEKANKLRKIIGKKLSKEEFAPYFDPWLKEAGALIGKPAAVEMWHNFEQHSGYSFNKSHAVSYSYIGYVTAWLKLKYPLEYIYGLLKSEKKDTTRMTYLLEAYRLGIEILAPDVNNSEADIVIKNDSLLLGLSDVKSVGLAACDEIISKRAGGYKSWDDFTSKVVARRCNSRVIESLVAVDAFKNVSGSPRNPNAQQNYQEYLNYPIFLTEATGLPLPTSNLEDYELSNFSLVCAITKSIKRTNTYVRLELEDATSNITCFGSMDNDLASNEVVLALVGDNSMLGYTRLSGLKERIQQSSWANKFEQVLFDTEIFNEFSLLYKFGIGTIGDDKALIIPLQVKAVTTKKGSRMCFAYFIDKDLEIAKITIFPKAWQSVQNHLFEFVPALVRLKRLEDGGWTIWDDGIVSARSVLERKREELQNV